MAGVHARHPDDLDVAALYADAMMNLTPWELWDVATGEPAAGARTLEIKQVLEQALEPPRRPMAHPGLLHLYVHLMEMSAHPEQALPAADLLRTLVPDAGHLLHMPTHIDVLCGDYGRSVLANHAAIAPTTASSSTQGRSNFYSLYRAHDLHFRSTARCSAASRRSRCRPPTSSRQLAEELLSHRVAADGRLARGLRPDAGARADPLRPLGRADRRRRCPRDPELYCSTTATIHYGRGVAHAATGPDRRGRRRTGGLPRGRTHASRTRATCSTTPAATSSPSPRRCSTARSAYREGNFDEAFAHLRRAIELDDALPYDEPWGWMQPTRHAYGALLLEQGQRRGGRARLRRRPRPRPDAEPRPASTRATCGACTATTNACSGWAAPTRPSSSASSSSWPPRAPTSRSWRRAHAGSRSSRRTAATKRGVRRACSYCDIRRDFSQWTHARCAVRRSIGDVCPRTSSTCGPARRAGLIAHIVATYLSEGFLYWQIQEATVSPRYLNARDIGVSYFVVGIISLLTYRVARPWRWLYLLAIVGCAVIAVFAVHPMFTQVGHLCAVFVGLACYPLARGRPVRPLDPRLLRRTPRTLRKVRQRGAQRRGHPMARPLCRTRRPSPGRR